MSTTTKLEDEAQNLADSIAEDGSAEQVRVPKKGKAKKKGKGKKRRESVESKDEEGDNEEESASSKKKAKKKSLPKARVSSDIPPDVEATSASDSKQLESNVEALVTVDEGPKETVVEIQGDEKQLDELEEIVVKKESALIEADNVAKEGADSGEGSGEEKTDEKKDSEEKSKETGSEVEGATVRRRATLSDLKSESFDKGDGEQALSTAAVTEVRNMLHFAL